MLNFHHLLLSLISDASWGVAVLFEVDYHSSLDLTRGYVLMCKIKGGRGKARCRGLGQLLWECHHAIVCSEGA